MPAAPIRVHLNTGTILEAKDFDKRSNAKEIALVGVDDEIVVIIKDSVTALIMEPDSAKGYFGK